MRRAKNVLILIGLLSLGAAAFGIKYNMSALLTVPRLTRSLQTSPHFFLAFYAMSAVSLTCNVALAVCGVQFVRLRSNLNRPFVGLMIFEILYAACVIFVGRTVPGVGPSVASAAGVANGSLSPQLVALFPLWAPFVVTWASNKLGAPGPPLSWFSSVFN